MRIATFNILHGRSPTDGRVDLDRYAQAIGDLDADVVALQEVDHLQERSYGADLTALAAEALRADEHRFVAALSGNPGSMWIAADGSEQPDSAAYGVALLSRYPVRTWEVVRLRPAPLRTPLLKHGLRQARLVRDEPRVAVAAEVETPFGPITFANTHLTFLNWWNGRQLRMIRRSLAERSPLMVMGDLNMGVARASRISGLQPLATANTFPETAPDRQLDHLLVTADFPSEVVKAEARKLPVSDHLALTVEVE